MKQKPKVMWGKLLCLFLAIFFVTSCNDDESLFKEEDAMLKAYSHHYYSKFRKSKFLEDQIAKVQKSNKEQLKSGNDQNVFTIDTKIVQLIEAKNYLSYTFIANRSVPDDQYVDNYVLTVFNNGNFHQMYISYPILANGNYDMENAIITTIDGDALVQKSTSCEYSIMTWEETCVDLSCGSGQHEGDAQAGSCTLEDKPMTICSGAWVEGCTTGGSSGGSGSSGSGGTGGSGGGSGDSGSTEPGVISETDPIGVVVLDPPRTATQETDRNVERLMEQVKITKVAALINNLKSRLDTDKVEDGASYDVSVTVQNGIRQLTATEYPAILTRKGKVKLRITPETLVTIHMHNKEFEASSQEISEGIVRLGTPIYSSTDIIGFINFFNERDIANRGTAEAENDNDISEILVADTFGTVDSGIYALKVGDPERIRQLRNAFTNRRNEEKLRAEYLDELFGDNGCVDLDNACVLEKFVNFLKNYQINNLDGIGFGIDIYTAVTNDYGTIIDWIKI